MGVSYPREKGGKRLLLEALEINAVSHCNLSCAACARSAPVSAPGFADPAEVSRDLKGLAAVASAKTVRINGGEPLLHPRLEELLLGVRQSGVARCVELYTNGTLFKRAGLKWARFTDKIHVSSYPGASADKEGLERLKRLCRRSGKGLSVKDIRFFQRWMPDSPLRPAAAKEIFEVCQSAHAYSCHQVSRGRIYMCIQSLAAGAGRGETCAIRPLSTLRSRLERFLLRRTPLGLCRRCLGSCGNVTPHERVSASGWRKASGGGTIDRERLAGLRNDPWKEWVNYSLRTSIEWAGQAGIEGLPGMNWPRFWGWEGSRPKGRNKE